MGSRVYVILHRNKFVLGSYSDTGRSARAIPRSLAPRARFTLDGIPRSLSVLTAAAMD